MNKRSRIQGYMFKFGFVLFICIAQSQSFAFSSLDFKQFPFRYNIELVSYQKSDLKRNILNYFSYKQYLSDIFDSSDDILNQRIYYNRFLKLYNAEIKVIIDLNHKIFYNKITPIFNKNINNKFYHLLKIETLTHSA